MTFDKQKARAICDSEWKIEARYFDEETREIAQNLVDRANMLPAALDRVEELEAALTEERARRICHTPTDTVGHWPRYEQAVVDEAKSQLQREGSL